MQWATKIIATLGPASAEAEIIESLARAGANLFRLNFSHGSHDDHADRVKTIRATENCPGSGQVAPKTAGAAPAKGPLIRITAIADRPGGVAMAKIVLYPFWLIIFSIIPSSDRVS